MRAPIKRQRPGDIVFDDYIAIASAAAGDAWELHPSMPDGDLAEKYMLYIANLCTESDFDVSVGNAVEIGDLHGHAMIQTEHVENAALTLFDKTAWSSCYKDKGGVLTDYSSEAESAATNDIIFDFSAANDALYFGAPKKFRSLLRTPGTAGVYNAEFVWEYWNGSAWVEFDEIASASGTGAGDPAHPFITTTAAIIRWELPEDWVKLNPAGDPVEMYWCRARVASFTSITTAPRISRLYQTPGSNFNIYGYEVPNMFNGNDITIVLSNETQITVPTRLYIQIKEI